MLTFISFRLSFKGSDTVQGLLIIFFCGVHVPFYSVYNFFLEGERKLADEEKFT